MGLDNDAPGLDHYRKLVEEQKILEEQLKKHTDRVEGKDMNELLEQLGEDLDDVHQARMIADDMYDSESEIDDNPDWSRLQWGKIYKDGYFGEKMFRVGDWKDYRFGKSKNKLPQDRRFSEFFDRDFRGGLPNYNFIMASKRPQVKENRHLRYMRRFSKMSRDNPSMHRYAQQYEGRDDGFGVRRRRHELPTLHPRVEQALGAMFEDMARTREFRYEDEY